MWRMGARAVPGVEYVAWVAKLPHSLVLIHDLKTFLSRAEAADLDEALPPLTPYPSPPRGEGSKRDAPLPSGERGRGEGAPKGGSP